MLLTQPRIECEIFGVVAAEIADKAGNLGVNARTSDIHANPLAGEIFGGEASLGQRFINYQIKLSEPTLGAVQFAPVTRPLAYRHTDVRRVEGEAHCGGLLVIVEKRRGLRYRAVLKCLDQLRQGLPQPRENAEPGYVAFSLGSRHPRTPVVARRRSYCLHRSAQ